MPALPHGMFKRRYIARPERKASLEAEFRALFLSVRDKLKRRTDLQLEIEALDEELEPTREKLLRLRDMIDRTDDRSLNELAKDAFNSSYLFKALRPR